MGVNCQIIKSKTGEVTRVVAPNGKDSILYGDALAKATRQDAALKAWATAYTEDFGLYYGDWQHNPQPDQDLDENGEPVLNDVMSFIESRRGIAPPLTDADIMSLRSIMIPNNIRDVEELNQAISSFIRGGEVVVNKKTLIGSGLYDVDEINRILSSPEATSNLKGLISRFNSMMLGPVSNRNRYLLSNYYEGDLDSMTDSYTESGKKSILNPYKVENEIRKQVGGIKDRSEFDQAFAELPYESVVERYQSDAEYADRMFERYSSYDVVNVMDAYGANKTSSSLPTLISYSFYNKKASTELKSDIAALVAVDAETWQEAGIIKEGLRRVTENGAKMGIDLVGLENSYDEKQQSEIEDFLLGLDLFVRSLAPGRELDTSFAADYDSFFGLGQQETAAVMLNENERQLNIVVFNDNTNKLSDVQLYENYGIIRLRDDIFHKVEKQSKEDLYRTLYDLQDSYNQVYGKSMLPIGDTANKSREEVISDLKEWINKNKRYDQSEEMALNKAIFGFSLQRSTPDVDVQRQLNRYMERSSHTQVDAVDALRLRQLVLKEKIKGSALYNDVLSNIVFGAGGYSVSLENADPITLRDMELSVSGEILDLLMRFSLDSNTNIQDLFFLEDRQDINKTLDFYKDLYSRHPHLAPEIDVDYEILEDGRVKTYYSSNLGLVGGVLMEKIAEDGGYSVFQDIGKVDNNTAATYQMRSAELKPESYTLKSYDKGRSAQEFVKQAYVEKESVLTDIINKRSC